MDSTGTRPQRANLRFCKAFFEIREADGTRDRLLDAGAQELLSDAERRWYVWYPPDAFAQGFLIRTRGSRLVLEGPNPGAVGRAYRQLDDLLQPVAEARVAVGDDLGRFVPRPRIRTADRPENFSKEHEAQVLAEFHSALYSRWADAPQQRLQGMTPRQAAVDPTGQRLLADLLQTMRAVEEERTARGMPTVSVDELERSVFSLGDLGS
ncbi:MAG: hypothetical protein GKS06_17000 [Acidobacteria bacterium]|nr:hypothetical protein [Acidobacteriota bacterium]